MKKFNRKLGSKMKNYQIDESDLELDNELEIFEVSKKRRKKLEEKMHTKK